MQFDRSRLRLAAVTVVAGASLCVLLATRPTISPQSLSRGDDLALTAAWVVAVVASAWLGAVSAVCLLAIGVRRPHLARALALALPPALRRSVEVAIVASCLAVSAAPAHAATSGPGLVIDQPVVRASRSVAVAPTTRLGSASRPAASAPPTTATARLRAPAPAPGAAPIATPTTSAAPRVANPPTRSAAHPSPTAPAPAPRSSPRPAIHAARVVVRRGDNLWAIARAELIRSRGAYPADAEVARYWRAVIDANRATLRSGNPSLIFPGEIIALPPVPPLS